MKSRTPPPRLALAATLLLLAGCGEPPASLDAPFGPSAAALSPTGESGVDAGETIWLLVGQTGELPSDLEEGVTAAGGTLLRRLPQIGVAVVASEDPAFEAAARGLPGVGWVFPDVEVAWVAPSAGGEEVASTSDFGTPPTSGDDDGLFNVQWGHAAIGTPAAWDAGARGAGARVVVLDAGIDADHPDLAPGLNTALSTSFVPGEAFDDVVTGVFSHGSHVAGIIAAADNGVGVIGVAPEAEIVAVKVLRAGTGSGSLSWILQGLVYAGAVEADVVNMSLEATLGRRGAIHDAEGTLVAHVPARAVNGLIAAFTRAASFARSRGATLVASAGNGARDRDGDRDLFQLPADLPGVIAVAATGPFGWGADPDTDLDRPTPYSNTGRSAVDLAAPGGNLDATISGTCFVGSLFNACRLFDQVMSATNAGWAWTTGTSMAAAHASGVAALVVGRNGGAMRPARVEAVLRGSADDLGDPGRDPVYGAGRVNAARAVGAAP